MPQLLTNFIHVEYASRPKILGALPLYVTCIPDGRSAGCHFLRLRLDVTLGRRIGLIRSDMAFLLPCHLLKTIVVL